MSDFWTTEKEELLVQWRKDGKTASEIGAHLRCTRNAVLGRAHRMNLPKRPTLKPKSARAPQSTRLPSMPSPAVRLGIVKPAVRVQRAKAKIPTIKLTAHPLPLQTGARLTILTLSAETCKWPIGDVGHDDFCFCGHAPRDGSPYCEFHAQLSCQPKAARIASPGRFIR